MLLSSGTWANKEGEAADGEDKQNGGRAESLGHRRRWDPESWWGPLSQRLEQKLGLVYIWVKLYTLAQRDNRVCPQTMLFLVKIKYSVERKVGMWGL